MDLRIYGCDEPELRMVCEKVDVESSSQMESIAKLKDDMAELMYENCGCGLAATQIGCDKRFVIIDCTWDSDTGKNKNPMMMINPEVLSTSEGRSSSPEGCLSVPGVNVIIERPTEIFFSYYDEDGCYHEQEADGFLARCIQHEIDHLDGSTIIDKLSGLKKIQAIAMLSAAKKQGISVGDPAVYIVK